MKMLIVGAAPFINQVDYSKYMLQPQLMRYNASVDTPAPNKSLMLSVNWP